MASRKYNSLAAAAPRVSPAGASTRREPMSAAQLKARPHERRDVREPLSAAQLKARPLKFDSLGDATRRELDRYSLANYRSMPRPPMAKLRRR